MLTVASGSCDSNEGADAAPGDGGAPDGNVCGTLNIVEGTACYTGPLGTLGVGSCGAGTWRCSAVGVPECEGQRSPTAEICDFRDNDCNGLVDDGVVPTDEICDRIDNDCNGAIDDGLVVPEGCRWCDQCPPEHTSPPTVACAGRAKDAGGADDAGFSGDAGASGDPGNPSDAGSVECDLPSSVCEGEWLVFWTNGRCVDGMCQWDVDFEYCTDGCSTNGCVAGFT